MDGDCSAVFLINLVQDVTVLRPLVYMARRDFGFDTLLLVSRTFCARDHFGIWRNELQEMSAAVGVRVEFFDHDLEARGHLTASGLLFSASESDVPNHATTHNLFRHAPQTYLRVTLQHGFECVGFHHSADHVRAHGQSASFAADFICAWAPFDKLASIAPSQRPKVLVTGPTMALQLPNIAFKRNTSAPGLVCENLHSVRFQQAGKAKSEFVDAFAQFALQLEGEGRTVTLRPHPGGQYSLKSKLALPPNVMIDNSPAYRLDLRQFAYGISAPSSVLIEMLMAGIPTAVWRDGQGVIDADAYKGLATVSNAAEWLAFTQAAANDPQSFLGGQSEFLARTSMPLEPKDVYRRFARLFQFAGRMEIRAPSSVAECERILFVANGNLPTLQLSFEKPLAPLVARGEVVSRLLTEQQIRAEPRLVGDEHREAEWIERFLDRYNPSAIVFCRYSGPAYRQLLDWAHRQQVPVIYHIDDDLLSVPKDIGERKFAIHNAPARISAVTDLLTSPDLVYASTKRLKQRLLGYFPGLPIVAGKIYCSGSILRRPVAREACKIGYMASADHAHNLEMVLPAIERLLEHNPRVSFETFGSISLPERLARFGERVTRAPPISNYVKFLDEFAQANWDIGICPLVPIDFNLSKANTKWVEYTASGCAVVASRGTVYDDCCADGCGILADGVNEWFSALDELINNVDERIATVRRAQAKLEREYSITRLREQVLNILEQGRDTIAARERREQKEGIGVCRVR